MSFAVGPAAAVAVALFAVLSAAHAQEDADQYWRSQMGPSVLADDQEAEKASKPGSEFTECASGCPIMVVVPAGRFTMGSPATEADRSAHRGPAT